MSAVLMCDTCAQMFSQAAVGYETYTRQVRDPKSGAHMYDSTMHICAECVICGTTGLKPRLGITS